MEPGRALRALIIALVCACALAGDADSRVVRTAQGPVRGYRDPEGDLFVYHSIPYATAPQGTDRFKAPLPPPIWTSTLEAVDKEIVCPQLDTMNYIANRTMTPDCLIANVYVPDTAEINLPVLVIVHGGAYQVGFGDMLTPKNLVKSKKIIAVTFNYRLGAHGFLCLGTPDAPGNAGMKDQVALLRWVRKNIASFGGNPNDVTIQGYSAGSSAVDLLQLSKTTKGLIHKVIPESGSNLASWSVQIDPIANAKEHATSVKFENVDDFYALEEFYKTASFEVINKVNIFGRKDNNFVFTPCIERDIGVERFLEDAPVNILKKGTYSKLPMLYGFADMEGLFRVDYNYESFKNGMNENFSQFLPLDLQFKSEEEKEDVAKRVKEFYFGDKEIGQATILQHIDYFTDTVFAYPTLRSVTLQVEAGNNNIYLYEYSFANEDAQMPEGVSASVRGANHCAQSWVVQDGIGPFQRSEKNITEDIKEIKAIVREVWLNFMTTGKPVSAESKLPAWPVASASRSPYMKLDLLPQLQGELLPARARLWDEIYSKHYRVPSPPPTPPPKRSEL